MRVEWSDGTVMRWPGQGPIRVLVRRSLSTN
jgi:hypothetical protein